MQVKLKINLLFSACIFASCLVVLSLSNGLLVTLPVQADQTQNVAVSITVPPRQSDFQFNFGSTDGLTNVNQNTILSYQITYGVKPSAGVGANTTIVADFSNDLAPNSSDVLDYIVGSASNAYAGTVPVVDLSNRTITWTIPNLPVGTTDQTVTFQLETNSNYTGNQPVHFTIRAAMSNQYLTLPDQTVNQTYQFATNSPTPTTTPTNSTNPTTTQTPTSSVSNPTTTPTINQTTTPTPTPAPYALKITNVSLNDISSTSVTMSVATSDPAKLTVAYGTNPVNLAKIETNDQLALAHDITLSNLLANTVYYFRITAIDKNGSMINSEIFTFKTAKESEQINLQNAAATIVSGGNTIFSKIIDNNYSPGFAILPDNTNYEFIYTLPGNASIRTLTMIIESDNPTQNPTVINMVQKNQQLFVADSKTLNPGFYEIFVSAKDTNGNLTQLKILDLKVTPRLAVFSLDDKLPLSDARVFLYYFDSESDKYEPVTSEIFGNVSNPQFTDKNGEINIILPVGKYKAVTNAFGYDENLTEFTLGPKDGQDFPMIYLKKNIFNFPALFNNIENLFIDSLNNFKQATSSFSSSIRFFDITAAFITGFALFSFLLFLLRTHIKPGHVPTFLLFNFDLMLSRHKQKYIYGIVIDKDNNPISKALVELLDKDTKNVISHTTTNKRGYFQIRNNSDKNTFKLLVTKDGYRPTGLTVEDVLDLENGLKIILIAGDKKILSASNLGIKILEHLGESLFESSLLLSIVLEFVFLYFFGFAKTIPFFILSLINILLWLFYLNGHDEYK